MKFNKKSQSLKKLPFALHRKNTYILPNRYGLVFSVILVGMLIGSINYNNNLGFLLTFLLGSIMFVSIFKTVKNIQGIKILGYKTNTTFAGDTAIIEFLIQTDKTDRGPIKISQHNNLKTYLLLKPNCESWHKIPVQTKSRGLHNLGQLEISTEYPLGLFKAWTSPIFDIQYLVYPKPIPTESEPVTDDIPNLESTNNPSKTRGVDDFKGLKSYMPGDPPQHMAWNVYARQEKLHIKNFAGESGRISLIDFEHITDLNKENRISQMSYLVLKAYQAHEIYTLKIKNKTVGPGSGKGHRHNCLKTLATI